MLPKVATLSCSEDFDVLLMLPLCKLNMYAKLKPLKIKTVAIPQIDAYTNVINLC